MSPHIALIRGINVGRANRVAMADLRAMIEALGCRDVRTILNSGNVVFTPSPAVLTNIASRMERGLELELGVSASVIVLSSAELARVFNENPLLNIATNPSRLLVAVFKDSSSPEVVESLLDRDWGTDRLEVGTRAAYMWCPNGILSSQIPKAIERLIGKTVTTRNWGTISKLHLMVTAQPTSQDSNGDHNNERKSVSRLLPG